MAYRFAQAVSGTVDVVEYRLAPEHLCPAAVEDSLRAYQWLFEDDGLHPGRIIFTGESTGAGLAVATALQARAHRLPVPAGVAIVSPLVDLALGGATIDAHPDTEPICSREFLTKMASLYLQGRDPVDPLASPVYGDLGGLPPVLIQVAENEALFGAAERLSEAVSAAGVEVETHIYPDSVHVFPLFAFLDEASRALAMPVSATASPLRRTVKVMASLAGIPLTTLDGRPTSLADYADRALLVVNVASKCGLTPQYSALEQLARDYADRGLTVIGVPCNQFMSQEPGTAEEIQTFCSTTYGVTFPLLAKTEVNGPDRHPLYAELAETPDADGAAGDIQWNFEKFLIAPGGAVVNRFRPQTTPDAPEVIAAIEAILPN